MVDETSDSSQVEQTTFIIRYLTSNQGQIEIVERFLRLQIAVKTLKENEIPLTDCRGQGYDNGANMVGKYEGVQSHIIQENSLPFYHLVVVTLNLCGTDSAECCLEAITLFGTIQYIYIYYIQFQS